jgi:hypothetical protein
MRVVLADDSVLFREGLARAMIHIAKSNNKARTKWTELKPVKR